MADRIAKMILMTAATIILTPTNVTASESELNLRKKLFKNHSPEVRPVLKNKDPISVNISIAALRLLEIKEKGDSFSMVVLVRLSWNDYQLKWNESVYDNLTYMNIAPSVAWRPDIKLQNYINDGNSEHGGFLKRMNTDMILSSDGTILWESRLVLKTMCNIDVRYYPNDYHKCVLHFESATQSKEKLTLSFDQSDREYIVNNHWYYENLAWEIVHYCPISRTAKDVSSEEEEVFSSSVAFYFIFRRKSVFFINILVISIPLTTALMIFIFFLPDESGERMGVALTLMLAALVFIVQVAENIPLDAPGGSVPRLAIFFQFCLLLKTLMIITLIFTSRLYNKTKPMGEWTKKRILENLAYTVKVKDRARKSRLMHQKEVDKDDQAELDGINQTSSGAKKEEEDESRVPAEKWKIVAKTVDRCLFIFFCIVFVTGGIAISISISIGSKIAYRRMLENVNDFGYDFGYG